MSFAFVEQREKSAIGSHFRSVRVEQSQVAVKLCFGNLLKYKGNCQKKDLTAPAGCELLPPKPARLHAPHFSSRDARPRPPHSGRSESRGRTLRLAYGIEARAPERLAPSSVDDGA
jgi:hypothetical protein